MSSMCALIPMPLLAVYSATKVKVIIRFTVSSCLNYNFLLVRFSWTTLL